jgi:hypothetical protein
MDVATPMSKQTMIGFVSIAVQKCHFAFHRKKYGKPFGEVNKLKAGNTTRPFNLLNNGVRTNASRGIGCYTTSNPIGWIISLCS